MCSAARSRGMSRPARPMMQATACLPMPDVRQRDLLTEAAHDRLVAAADPARPIPLKQTAHAVRAFQKQHSLKTDGVVGPAT